MQISAWPSFSTYEFQQYSDSVWLLQPYLQVELWWAKLSHNSNLVIILSLIFNTNVLQFIWLHNFTWNRGYRILTAKHFNILESSTIPWCRLKKNITINALTSVLLVSLSPRTTDHNSIAECLLNQNLTKLDDSYLKISAWKPRTQQKT